MTSSKVFLVRNVSSEKFGGGEIYQLNLARELCEAGFEPIILTNSKMLLKKAKELGVRTLKPPYIRRQNWSGIYNFLLPVYFIKLRRIQKWYEEVIAREKPAVVNIQSRDEWIAVTRAAKKYDVRVLWTDHADFKNWVLWNVNSKIKNVIGKVILHESENADEVIFVGENIRKETDKMISPKKIKNSTVIRNGVFDEKADFTKIKCRKNNFVFIGRVVEEKGIRELIEAFKEVRKKYLEAVLNIYGEGEIEKYKNVASDGVVFHGRTDEPLNALAENDVFVLPSYCEGLSLSLLDAVMMGKKIIVSDVGGNSEIVTDDETGLLVSPRDVRGLVNAMMCMIENPDKAERMAEDARKIYEKNFNFEKIFKNEMLPLYNYNKGKENKK